VHVRRPEHGRDPHDGAAAGRGLDLDALVSEAAGEAGA